MVSVKWTDGALDDLQTIDPLIAKRIVEKVLWFEKNFDLITPERLHGDLKSLYKVRIGDYRVIYSTNKKVIVIEAIGHRRNIYKRL